MMVMLMVVIGVMAVSNAPFNKQFEMGTLYIQRNAGMIFSLFFGIHKCNITD